MSGVPWYRKNARAFVIAGIGAIAIGVQLWRKHIPDRSYIDEGILTKEQELRQNQYLSGVMAESGVDMRVMLTILAPGEDIDRRALDEARRRGLGRTSDRRGLFLLWDQASGRMRIEVGPQLEGILTDAFIGNVLRSHTAPVRGEETPLRTLSSTFQLIHHRIREAAIDLEYDPALLTAIQDSVRLAAGAGATFSSAGNGEAMQMVRDSLLERLFAPGVTPEAALATYEAWSSLPFCLPRATMLTPASREFFTHDFKVTPGWWDLMRYVAVGKERVIRVRGDLAVAYAVKDPLVQPLFFRQTPEGWMVDIMAELLHSQNLVGSPWTWRWEPRGDEWDRAYRPILCCDELLLRFRDGANEPLPWRGEDR